MNSVNFDAAAEWTEEQNEVRLKLPKAAEIRRRMEVTIGAVQYSTVE